MLVPEGGRSGRVGGEDWGGRPPDARAREAMWRSSPARSRTGGREVGARLEMHKEPPAVLEGGRLGRT